MEGILKKILALGFMVAALAILILGCGSNSDSETSKQLSKVEFLKQGNQICKKRLKEKDAAVKKAFEESLSFQSSNPSKHEEKELAQLRTEVGKSIVSRYKQIGDELSQLQPPSKDDAAVKEIVAHIEAGVRKAESNFGRVAETAPLQKAGEAAEAYGLSSCVF